MTHSDLLKILVVCRFIAFGVWGILFLLLFWYLIRKEYQRLKLIILYCLNSVVFFFVWGYIVSLAIIVQAPGGGRNREESIAILKSHAYDFFFEQCWISLAFIVGISLFNMIYMRFVLKQIYRRIIITLGIAHAIILLAGSILACMNYYTALMSEINFGYDRLDGNSRVNNVIFHADSTIRLKS